MFEYGIIFFKKLNLEFWEILENWNFENLEFWKILILKLFENWNFGKLNLEIGILENYFVNGIFKN